MTKTLRDLLFAVVAIALCVVAMPVASAQSSGVSPASAVVYGTPGDWVTGGNDVVLNDTQGDFSIGPNYGTFDRGVSVLFSSATDSWDFQFAAPDGVPLAAGDAFTATRFPFNEPGVAGMDFSGNGRGCNALSGEFRVYELSFAADGTVQTFSVDFRQSCDGGPDVVGGVRLNSTLADTDRDFTIGDGQGPVFRFAANNAMTCQRSIRGSIVGGTGPFTMRQTLLGPTTTTLPDIVVGSTGWVATGPLRGVAAGSYTVTISLRDAAGNGDAHSIEVDLGAACAAISCDGQAVTHDLAQYGVDGSGTAGNDVFYGTAGPDEINAKAGDDVICGRGGDDTILGGPGDDRIFAANGEDRVYGGPGADYLDGGTGPDFMRGDAGADMLLGRAGADALFGGADGDLIAGGPGEDLIRGGDGNDVLRGGADRDDIYGAAGDDRLDGGPGDDELQGGPGIDVCNGSVGTNYLTTCETVPNLP